MSACGLYFLSNSDVGFGLGELLSVICALAYSFHIILTGEFARRCEIYSFVCAQFFAVAVLCLVCALILEDAVKFDQPFFIAVGITAIFATVLAFIVQTIAQKYTSAVKASLIFTFESVSAGLIGYFLGGEILTPMQIFGAFVIIAGILFSESGAFFKDKILSTLKNK